MAKLSYEVVVAWHNIEDVVDRIGIKNKAFVVPGQVLRVYNTGGFLLLDYDTHLALYCRCYDAPVERAEIVGPDVRLFQGAWYSIEALEFTDYEFEAHAEEMAYCYRDVHA